MRFLSTLLLTGSCLWELSKMVRRDGQKKKSGHMIRRELSTTDATRRYMMYVLLPVWFVPGILDWIWHRQTKIETTSGTRESLIHSLMMTEVGLPILIGLFLDINAGVFALMIAAATLHEATAFWDVAYAVSRRKVTPREQHTHSFLEVIPLAAVSFIACLHPGQFRALFGAGSEEARFGIHLKRPPLPAAYVASILGAVAMFIAAPYAEEVVRCWVAEKKGLAGRDTPECSRVLFGQAEGNQSLAS
jgi:hypothetical protein